MDQGAQYRPRHNPLHLRQKRRPPCCPGVALKLTVANLSCLISLNPYATIHPAADYITVSGH